MTNSVATSRPGRCSASIILPFQILIVLVTILYRWCVSLHSYSGKIIWAIWPQSISIDVNLKHVIYTTIVGQNTPPLFGDYEGTESDK
jgi:hypothetical protein